MSNINQVTISGNLTRDAEIRSTTAGTSVLNFSVAVNDRIKSPSTGQWEDRPNFFDCVCFGRRADSLHPLLTKGTKVAIAGKLRWSGWDADGQRRSKVEIVVDELELMQQRQQTQYTPDYAPETGAAEAEPYEGVYDAEMPF